MAKKIKTVFECTNCGYRSIRYMGRCPSCKEYDSLEEVIENPEQIITSTTSRFSPSITVNSKPLRLHEISDNQRKRYPIRSSEFARVLGGGLVPGSIILVGGDPGIGKSTLLLQFAADFSLDNGRVLYVSGEESETQIKMRGERLQLQSNELFIVTETSLEAIFAHVQTYQPDLLIVDSIQTTHTADKTASVGSVSQVRECASRLQTLAKQTGITVILIGHVTKEGTIAGPRVLEHIVDVVLFLEGDTFQLYRLLRSVKNRFGATNETGVFEMRGAGMVEVHNPSEAFLAERVVNAPGSAIAVTLEGTRPLLIEIQALTSFSAYPNPSRNANGIDFKRLQLLIAVLTQRVGFKLYQNDIFVNVVAGMSVTEPAADLAIATAIASSMRDIPIPADLAIVGEVGLSGELRAVSQLGLRLNEAAKLGFKRVLIPKTLREKATPPDGLQILQARSLPEALRIALPEK
ncbi:MAG: DNA repair protein RadA [Phototrophicales bacterium]|nr:MAG: DNA repair protein RadA [Phototrophicales bacterium]